ncbi:MAG: outer membrane lipid asymmetry maintenance protein MlaD [Desulfobacteraceae bacterium]|nr:MAG: outer membrane lipid asymmetry maintenance protein MlaD [Desulfobacteraceae bacterium]
MKKASVELMVGLFVLAGIISVGYLAVRLGKMEIIGKNTYTLYGQFQSVTGLTRGANVEIAGVQVGQVTNIHLDPETQSAVVTMKIDKTVELTDDVIASLKTAGLIGDKFIKLTPGGSDLILKDGDRITETESGVDLEELISKYVFGGV